jgi:hypothetical protein
MYDTPIAVAERSNARVCGRSLADIAGSSPAELMNVPCACSALPGRGICDWLINHPEESY